MPTPIAHREGWPWETAGAGSLDAAPRVVAPRITVVTPSYNQGSYLERTLRSVLLQEYPNLEYLVVDGGSADESVSIIKHYGASLDYWVSEPDSGQANAINKGLRRATGEVVGWLNSDDFYLPGTLDLVASTLSRDSGHVALVGNCLRIHQDRITPVLLEGSFESRRRLLEFWKDYTMHQPSIFWRRELTEEIGLLDERFEYAFDFDYWVRIAEHHSFYKLGATLSTTLYHPAAKTGDGFKGYHTELQQRARSYWGSRLLRAYWRLAASYKIQKARNRLQLRTRLKHLANRTQ